MKEFAGFKHGVNLGGWLSQCDHTKEHYDTFITESDIKRIVSWGVDHVRLPVDYNLVQEKNGKFIEKNFAYIDNCIKWCHANKLNIVLDLHKTNGYSFDEGENETGFFYNDTLIDAFLALWEEFSKRYASDNTIAFELLNEVVEPSDNVPWMKIAKRAVEIVRKYSMDKKIVIGGYYNNSVVAVKDISDFKDENIIYSFHCYEPLLFTHQGAHWIKEMDKNFRVKYPMTKAEYVEALERGTGTCSKFTISDYALKDDAFDTKYFENMFEEAISVANERNVALYCGEYGVINLVDNESTMNWLSDIAAVFEKHNISRSIWTYKEKDFGLIDSRFDSVRDKLVKLL